MCFRYVKLTNRLSFNTLRPRRNGRHFANDIFKCIFLNENVWIPIKISLKFVPQGSINNIPALVQIMAWGRPGDKPLSGAMMVRLPTHKCVTRPQWVKTSFQKVDQHTGSKWLIHGIYHRKDNQLQRLELPCRIPYLGKYICRWNGIAMDINMPWNPFYNGSHFIYSVSPHAKSIPVPWFWFSND